MTKLTRYVFIAVFLLSVSAAMLGPGFMAVASADNPHADNTQGKSESNPDGSGVDKPYDAAEQSAGSQGAGGDGNNGCGQEKKAGFTSPDYMDDNNGHCGFKPGEDDGGGED